MTAAKSKPTRGERNCNPFNIRESSNDGTHWYGERATDDDKSFEEFIEPIAGIRAGCKIFLTYQRKYNLMTVRQLITRFAPPVENNTGAYVAAVANGCHVDEDELINLSDLEMLRRFAYAVIRHENGRVIYDATTITKGVELALA